MTIRLPTIDYKAVQNLLATDPTPTVLDLGKLDAKTQGMAAVKILEGRKATSPTDNDKLQEEIDMINSGQMPSGQVQQILDSASTDELKEALFQTGYGISVAQFEQFTASNDISDEDLGKLAGIRGETVSQVKNRLVRTKLGEEYGFTPTEIDDLLSTSGADRTKLITKLGQMGKAGDIEDAIQSIKGNSAAQFEFKVGPLVSSVSLNDFITAIVAAIEAILRGKSKLQQSDSTATQLRMNDVINQAKDRIDTMKQQAATQVSQLRAAVKQIKDAKLLQTIVMVATYIITIAITIAVTVATFGAAGPVAVLVAAIVIASVTVFFALQMADLQRSDGSTWIQRAADKRYGKESDAKSAKEADHIRQQKQQFMSFLSSIQIIVDVITAVLSFGASTAGTAARVATEATVKTIMQQIARVIQEIIEQIAKNLTKMLTSLTRALGLALMVGSGTIGAMAQSGQLQDLLARNSSYLKAYRDKIGKGAIDQRVTELKEDPMLGKLSDGDIRAYATQEQNLINNGDQAQLAELYARRDAYTTGATSTLNISNLGSGASMKGLNAVQQAAFTDRAGNAIQQRTGDAISGYKTAISEYTQKNQGLLMGIQIGAAVGTLAGGALSSSGSSAGKSGEAAEDIGANEAKQFAQKLATKMEGELELGAKAAAKSPGEAADANKLASKIKSSEKIQQRAMLVQALLGPAQQLLQSASQVYQAELDIQTIKKKLELNEKMRHFQLMLVLQELAVNITNMLKEDMFDIQGSAIASSKSIGTAIESIWKGLEAGLDAAVGSKQ